MSNSPLPPIAWGETPYRAMIRQTIMAWKEGGEIAAFNVGMVAEAINRKPTRNLRAALQALEKERIIYPYRFYTNRGGLALAWSFQPPLGSQTNDSPF